MPTNNSLRILIYGSFGWEHLASSFRRAFEQIGHEVVPVDTRQAKTHLAPWLINRWLHRLTIDSLKLRRYGASAWNQQILPIARQTKPHLALVLGGEFLMPETVHALRSDNIPVFIFHPDNPFPPLSNNRPETLPCALACDVYLIWSHSLIARLKQFGVKHVEYLPFAWDAEIFPYADPQPPAAPITDLVFIGGWDKEREAWLTPLAQRFDLKIWGPPYWKTRSHPTSPLRACWQGGAVMGHQAAQILRESRVVLNILRGQNLPDGVNMRTFEVPGCGGFLLSNRSTGAEALFAEFSAGAYFDTPETCAQQIEFYLTHEDERRRIMRTAHRLVDEYHHYSHRAKQIIDVYHAHHP